MQQYAALTARSALRLVVKVIPIRDVGSKRFVVDEGKVVKVPVSGVAGLVHIPAPNCPTAVTEGRVQVKAEQIRPGARGARHR